jgi:MerR family transcriptional regulator, thiopeptide resistance regulator
MEGMNGRFWRISEVVKRAHVTPRTLHHYDTIGLLVPSRRTEAGYRLYSEADLERLHQIMLFRELGFSLEAIAKVVDEPGLDRLAALRAQRELLVEERARTDAIIGAVDRLLETMEKGERMSTDDIFEGFDAFANAPDEVRTHRAAHQQEVRDRWGDTDAYRESMKRARKYSRTDWKHIQDESEANEARMASLLTSGADPGGREARAGAEAMREHISRWFYDCDHEMHAGLADMYEADPRFAAHYDGRAPGLSSFVARAIRANAARGGA